MKAFGIIVLVSMAVISHGLVVPQSNLINPLNGQVLCSVCQGALNKLKAIIDQPGAVDQLKNKAKQVCQLYASYQQQCEEAIGNAVDNSVQLAQNPEQSCVTLHLCQQGQAKSNGAVFFNPLKGELMCSVCEGLMNELKTVLDQPGLMDQVKSSLKQFCQATGPYQQQCEDSIDNAVNSVVQMGQNPEQSCAMLHLCDESSSKSVVANNQASFTVGNSICSGCKMITEAVSKRCRQAEFRDQVVSVVESLCSKASNEEEKVKCEKFVHDRLPRALEELADPEKAEKLCEMIHVC